MFVKSFFSVLKFQNRNFQCSSKYRIYLYLYVYLIRNREKENTKLKSGRMMKQQIAYRQRRFLVSWPAIIIIIVCKFI